MRTNKIKNSLIYFKETHSKSDVYFIHRVHSNDDWETWDSDKRTWNMNPTPWNNDNLAKEFNIVWKLKKITEQEAFVELL